MASSYILSFPSREERDQFSSWCQEEHPLLGKMMVPAETRPDIVVKGVQPEDIEKLKQSPHSFKIFDDKSFDPAD
ncbi:hypothetical protein ABIF65_008263 [Bradyrhizobium japonicum]